MEKNKLQEFFNQIKNIAEKYEKRYEKIQLSQGENFNIFLVLKLNEKSAEEAHSNFLAELLNPGGSHGQGAVFLKKFIAILNEKIFFIENENGENEKRKWNLKNFNCENANVRREAHLIDILIESENKKIAIENKIYAGEQPEQLKRYGEYLENTTEKPEDRALLFLTLNGRKSDNHENFKEYYRISYRDDILKWLEECKKEVPTKFPVIRRGITDYINLIKILTNQTIYNEMNEEIKKVVEKNLKAYKMIFEYHRKIMKNHLYHLAREYFHQCAKEVVEEHFKDKGLSTDATPFSFSYKGYKININGCIYEQTGRLYVDFCLRKKTNNQELIKSRLKESGRDGEFVDTILKVKNNPEAFKNEIREIFTELIAAADEVEQEI